MALSGFEPATFSELLMPTYPQSPRMKVSNRQQRRINILVLLS